jgi:hypothetical protein
MPLYGYYSKIQETNTGKLYVYKSLQQNELVVTEVSSDADHTNKSYSDFTYIGEVTKYIKTIVVS